MSFALFFAGMLYAVFKIRQSEALETVMGLVLHILSGISVIWNSLLKSYCFSVYYFSSALSTLTLLFPDGIV